MAPPPRAGLSIGVVKGYRVGARMPSTRNPYKGSRAVDTVWAGLKLVYRLANR